MSRVLATTVGQKQKKAENTKNEFTQQNKQSPYWNIYPIQELGDADIKRMHWIE